MSDEFQRSPTRPITSPRGEDKVRSKSTITVDILKGDILQTQYTSAQKGARQQACLVLIYPDTLAIGSRFSIKRKALSFGREPENTVMVPLDAVSRTHAVVKRHRGAVIIQDLGSTNGTYVNGVRVKGEHVLCQGDLVGISTAIFKFLSGTGVEAAYHEAIYRLTIMDGLTEAYNSRYMMEYLSRELARCSRRGQSLSLVMFDLDHFKDINDEYGHLTGDMVLRELAKRMTSRIRKEEILVRYGGEEFVAVLPQTDNEGAMVFAEQIRKLVEQTPFQIEGETVKVTISGGVSTVDDCTEEPMIIVKRADENLYKAKHKGRNCIVG